MRYIVAHTDVLESYQLGNFVHVRPFIMASIDRMQLWYMQLFMYAVSGMQLPTLWIYSFVMNEQDLADYPFSWINPPYKIILLKCES